MENKKTISDELNQLCPLLSKIDNKNPYTVTSSYFSSVTEIIAKKIKSEVELNYYFSHTNPYQVPSGYFKTLSTTIIEEVRVDESKKEVFEEMQVLSPLLNTISKNPPYTVPRDYFKNEEWNNAEVPIKQAKVISFINIKNFIKYIAAAVIIGVLTIGMFLVIGKENKYSSAHNAHAASQVKKLTEQQIVDFLKTTSPTDNVASAINSTITKDKDIKISVSKIPDNEIQRFLQENGEQGEM